MANTVSASTATAAKLRRLYRLGGEPRGRPPPAVAATDRGEKAAFSVDVTALAVDRRAVAAEVLRTTGLPRGPGTGVEGDFIPLPLPTLA